MGSAGIVYVADTSTFASAGSFPFTVNSDGTAYAPGQTTSSYAQTIATWGAGDINYPPDYIYFSDQNQVFAPVTTQYLQRLGGNILIARGIPR